MASWTTVPSLESLRNEFNTIAPNRDKSSDGTVGDSAHASNSSDHNPDETGNTPDEDSDSKNEVHAFDCDKDLNADFTMEDCVQFLLSECRKSNDVGKDKGRLKYIIYNKRIWEASNGWAQRTYTGSNPHDHHAHFSFEYDSQYSEDSSPWGLIDRFGDDVAINDDDAAKIAWHVWMYALGDPNFNNEKTQTAGGYQRYAEIRHQNTEQVVRDEVAKVLTALDAVPTAEENASEVIAALNEDGTAALVSVLHSVLSTEDLAALKAAL